MGPGTYLIDIRYSVESYRRGLRGSSSIIEWDPHDRKRSKGEQRQWEDKEHIVSARSDEILI